MYVKYQAMIGSYCSQKVYVYFTYDTAQVCTEFFSRTNN